MRIKAGSMHACMCCHLNDTALRHPSNNRLLINDTQKGMKAYSGHIYLSELNLTVNPHVMLCT
jgi:hypothetical protein